MTLKQVCVLLATFGAAATITDRPCSNETKDISIRGYQGRRNQTAIKSAILNKENPSFESASVESKNYDESSSEEENAEREERNPLNELRTSTTQKYEDSKLLYNYVVPAGSARPFRGNTNKEDVTDEDEKEVEDLEEEEEEDERSNLKDEEESEEEDGSNLEDENELQEEEEEEEAAHLEDKEEEEEEEEHRPHKQEYRNIDREDEYENETEEEDHGHTDEERGTEKESTSEPFLPRRQGPPPPERHNHPSIEYTTIHPYGAPSPVSYSSVVYDPNGDSKTELTGSFYKRPLKTSPRSGVFQKDNENFSEDTKYVVVTKSPISEEVSLQDPFAVDIDEEEYTEPEAVTSNIRFSIQDDSPIMPRRIINLHPIKSWKKYKWDESGENEENEAINPINYNEKAKQEFHDKKNRVNYYEQTVNTKFSSKENGISEGDQKYESEVKDLTKPLSEEAEIIQHQTVNKDIVSGEDDKEELTEEPREAEKDRNQLYEYVVNDHALRQVESKNKGTEVNYLATTKKEVFTTQAPTEAEQPTTEMAKPMPFAFGTIVNPHSTKLLSFKNEDDVRYNKIVSDIQSLFKPTTPKFDYEHRFLPSQGSCKHQPQLDNSANYERFITPNHIHQKHGKGEEEEEEEEEDDVPMPRLPMKTYVVQNRLQPHTNIPKMEHPKRMNRPSGVKVMVYPREASTVSFRNAVYVPPLPGSKKLLKKIIYLRPNETPAKIIHYSPTNRIVRILRPINPIPIKDSLGVPSGRTMVIIRKL